MSQLTQLFQKHASTVQRCLLSQDPLLQLTNMQECPQKDLLLFLMSPHSQNFRQKLAGKYKIKGELLQQLDHLKSHEKIMKAKSVQQILYLIDKYVAENDFNYTKPAQISTGQQVNEKKSEDLKSKLSDSKSLKQWTEQFIKNSEHRISQLSPNAINSVDVASLMNMKSENKIKLLNTSFPKYYAENEVVRIMQKLYEEMKTDNKNYEFPESLLIQLTRSQLMKLGQSIPDLPNNKAYIGLFLTMKHHNKLISQQNTKLTVSEKDEKRKLMLALLKDLDRLSNMKTLSIRADMLKQLLALDISREDVDKQTFMQFINALLSASSNANRQIIQIDGVIQMALKQFFKKEDAKNLLKSLQQYFDHKRLNQIYAIVRISQGQRIQEYQDYLQKQALQKLKNSKQITILPTNKRTWKSDDSVELKIRVKNIKLIKIKVYRLDVEKIYSEKNTDIDQLENLSFIKPNHSSQYSINAVNPYLIQNFDIKVEGIQSGRGVWAVDLEGEGISSRAFIRKGVLAHTKSNNSVGTQINFYDQKGTHIKDYFMWMQGKRHSVASSFVVPYGQSNKNVDLMFVKDGFAEKLTVTVPKEQFKFDIGYLYNTQSFLIGSKAQILLHPRLSLSIDKSIQISLKLLQKTSITVSMTNNLGIKSSLVYNNITFKSTEDYLLQFPLQSYTSQIDIKIAAKIKKYNSKQEELQSTHSIYINLNEKNLNFIDLYLRRKKQGYFVYSLGKNGQPLIKTEQQINLTMLDRNQAEKQNLWTKQDGSVELGLLTDVTEVKVRMNLKSGAVVREWSLLNNLNNFQLQSGQCYIKGEDIVLLIPAQQIRLWKISDQQNIHLQNMNTATKWNGNKLTIAGLPSGKYKLYLINRDSVFTFDVVDGIKLEDSHQIYEQKKGVLYNPTQSSDKKFLIGQANFTADDQKTIIKIPIQANYDIIKDTTFRAHLIATNFVVPNFKNQFQVDTFKNFDGKADIQQFKIQQSKYYSNKILSDETSYVLNREKEKKYVGNNLQKPRIFLKRIQVGRTEEKEEVLNDDIMFTPCLNLGQAKCPANWRSDQKCKKKKRSKSIQIYNNLQINSHNNFLAIGSIAVNNQKGQYLQFTVPKEYSHFRCYAFNKHTCAQTNYDFSNQQQLRKKEVKHTGIVEKDQKHCLNISRQAYKVLKGTQLRIGRDCIWSAVGVRDLARFAKLKVQALEDWTINWSNYSEQQKLKVYDEKVCHQLNTYIKYHDKQFFSKIVKPFISNKIKKTFVDYCLLEDNQVKKRTSVSELTTLNQFEKVLLIDYLLQSGDRDQAQRIFLSMDNINKADPIPYETFRYQFDTILSAKTDEEGGQIKYKDEQDDEIQKRCFRGPQNIDGDADYGQGAGGGGGGEAVAECCADDDQEQQQQKQKMQVEDRKKYTEPFKQLQKTKQYTETTYSDIKQQNQSQYLVPSSPFWVSLARHLLNTNKKDQFLSQQFMYFYTKLQFTLATCFLPKEQILNYALKTEGEQIIIAAQSDFLVFVKEVKQFKFQNKFGVIVSQRIFDPDNKYYYEEDGTQVQREVDQFLIGKPYCLQTLVINTSGINLQLQLLIDTPQGSIPLKSHQMTQMKSIQLQSYSSLSHKKYFYFPQIGVFNVYPANVCKETSIIAKAQKMKSIKVVKCYKVDKSDNLSSVLRSGKKEEILQFLQNRNIFDDKIFDPSCLMWLLKDKQLFIAITNILKKRKYYNNQIWSFAYYHKNLHLIQQHEAIQNSQSIQPPLSTLPIFEYFPYYSSRTHKFLNENKTTIRNNQFKITYYNFLAFLILNQSYSTQSRIVFIYYLILQDRIQDAGKLLSFIGEEEREQYRVQFDYILCFVDMCQGYPSFSVARRIASKYGDYPIKQWRNMFGHIVNTMKQYDSQTIVEQETPIVFKANAINFGTHIKINLPAETRVEINFYTINIELYFSTFPFSDSRSLNCSVVSNKNMVFPSGPARQQNLVRQKDLKDCYVQILATSSINNKTEKIASFLWFNPMIKVRVDEQKGEAQIFFDQKKLTGCYCKVYQMKNGQSKFYRDGYTDVTGSFKYALSDLEGVTQFSILFVTDYGGYHQKVKPPSTQAFIS